MPLIPHFSLLNLHFILLSVAMGSGASRLSGCNGSEDDSGTLKIEAAPRKCETTFVKTEEPDEEIAASPEELRPVVESPVSLTPHPSHEVSIPSPMIPEPALIYAPEELEQLEKIRRVWHVRSGKAGQLETAMGLMKSLENDLNAIDFDLTQMAQHYIDDYGKDPFRELQIITGQADQ